MSLEFKLSLLVGAGSSIALGWFARPLTDNLKKKLVELKTQVHPKPDIYTLKVRYKAVLKARKQLLRPHIVIYLLSGLLLTISCYRPLSGVWRKLGRDPTGLALYLPDFMREIVVGTQAVDSFVGGLLAILLAAANFSYIGGELRRARVKSVAAKALLPKEDN